MEEQTKREKLRKEIEKVTFCYSDLFFKIINEKQPSLDQIHPVAKEIFN